MAWEDVFQSVVSDVASKAASAKWVAPYEIQKLQLEALGQSGYYTEGQAGERAATGAGLTITPTMLLLGLGVVAVVMLARD